MNDKHFHPFDNDPFATVWEAFHSLWPDADCTISWVGDIKDEDNTTVWGVTSFEEDDDIPSVVISSSLKVSDAVEVLAHELAHVAVGIDAGHGEAWGNAFDAIFKEYMRLIEKEEEDDDE